MGDEAFGLRAHRATALLRLHFVHDMVRLKRSSSTRPRLTVLLTNEPCVFDGIVREIP